VAGASPGRRRGCSVPLASRTGRRRPSGNQRREGAAAGMSEQCIVAGGARPRTGYDAPILDTDTPILILRYGDTAAEKNKDSPILQVYKKLINKNNNEDN